MGFISRLQRAEAVSSFVIVNSFFIYTSQEFLIAIIFFFPVEIERKVIFRYQNYFLSQPQLVWQKRN